MTEAQITGLLDRFTADPGLLAAVKADPLGALRERGILPSSLADLAMANHSMGLRALSSADDEARWHRGPTVGGQCTQAGCYTHEPRCASNYACSGSPNCK